MTQSYINKLLSLSVFIRLITLLLVLGFIAISFGFWRKSYASPVVTFTVTNTDDSGAGSLRQAILDANANQGTDTIAFNIGTGVQTIRPLTQLPAVTDPVVIDGATQPGFSGTPLIVIDGSLVTGSGDVYGLRISAGNSIVRSIAINNFQNPAPQALRIDTNGGNTVQGCYIGVDPNGVTRRRNYMGLVIASSDNLIGGTTAAQRNVISGSSFENINIVGVSSNNRIKGNFIGTNAAGTASLSDGSGTGVAISTPGTGNIVGGTEQGARNLISGNGQAGVSASAPDTIIQGNFIGTNVTGMLPVPNATSGVSISGANVLVGGTTLNARNIISGNGINGVSASLGSGTILPRVQGNYIGVDFSGRSVLPNGFKGIETSGSMIIGGTEPGAGNVISGNNTGGMTLSAFDNLGSTVQGNFIGTDVTGTVALGNGNGLGIDIRSSNNLIGGTTAAARNIISGNNVAIDIGGGTTALLTSNHIQGNYIGTDITGTAALPNRGAQTISVTGSNTTIGGTTAGAGNIIAYNNGVGVRITGSFGPNTGNYIRGNSFYLNGGLAIDLGAAGVTPNDACDADTGANNLQNYPVLASAVSNGTTTIITGTLNSTASATFNIDFYASPTFDASNFGEGKTYIGSASVATAANCIADFNVAVPFPAAGGQYITATATDSTSNTSEFSQYIRALGAGSKPNFDYDGDGKADLSVFRPSAGSWYLSYSSNNAFIATQFGANGDLIAPADFDGDGKTDISVFRPSDGGWYRLNSSNNTFTPIQFGTNGDLPVPGDFDGDFKADITVYRPSAGSWYRINSSNGQFIAAQFGIAEDKPLVGDFDGDGKSDLAVFRPSNGTWYRINSATDTFSPAQFGATGDLPVAADYDGDGKTDLAVYRPSVGDWYIINSSNSSFTGIHFGVTEDKPAPADFDGDGKADLVVFRPSSGTWYLLRTTAGFTGFQFGANGDVPTPNSYVR